MKRLTKILARGPLHLAILIICFVWTLPSVGLLVSSFRPERAVRGSGWWTAFQMPFTFTVDNLIDILSSQPCTDKEAGRPYCTWTLSNYIDALTGKSDYLVKCSKLAEELKACRAENCQKLESKQCSFLKDVASSEAGTGMGRPFINSLIISIPATIIPILISAFAAYAFSWMKFPGRDALFISVVGLLVVPLQMTLIPVLRLYTKVNLTGTWAGIWLAHTAYGLPFAIYLLRNFFGALPKDIFESAYLDGASELTAFFHIVLPLSVPSLASLAIFQFLWVWNDLLVALTYLGGRPSVAPLTVPISNLVSSLGAGWHLLTSAAFISMMLPLIVFFSLQRYFVHGILAGSVKG